jgi:hypothetical protein
MFTVVIDHKPYNLLYIRMEFLDKILFNLSTISKIPPGKKIGTTKEFFVIEDESIIQGFWRWKNSDSRDKTVVFICKEIKTAISLTYWLLESKYLLQGADEEEQTKRLKVLKKIKNVLLGTIQGINNLCVTYETDADIVGKLEPMCKELKEVINSINLALL